MQLLAIDRDIASPAAAGAGLRCEEVTCMLARKAALALNARTQSRLAGAGDAASHVRLPGLHGYINADMT